MENTITKESIIVISILKHFGQIDGENYYKGLDFMAKYDWFSTQALAKMRRILTYYKGCVRRTSIESGMSMSAIRRHGHDIIERFREDETKV